MKIAVVTLGDENVKHWNEMSFPNKDRYCQRHGYDFISIDHLLDDRPPGWSKILLLLQHLDDYDYLFWSDTDSLIVESQVRLEELFSPEFDLVFCMGGEQGELWTLNSGEFFVKNTEWSKNFLHEVYNQEFLVNGTDTDSPKTAGDVETRLKCGCDGCIHFRYDQKGFIHVISHMSELEKAKHIAVYSPDDSRYFNGYGENYSPGCFIQHFPGDHKNYDIFVEVAKRVSGEKNG